MNTNWHNIWEKRSANEEILNCNNPQKIFLELKRISGWDSTGEELSYEQFYNQYIQTKNELEFSSRSKTRPIKSIFEVGCGCGANLYLFQNDNITIGGIDYSSSEIQIARSVLDNPNELICDEAVNMPRTIKYDAVLSNSVFSYFTGYEYASDVLETMYQKTNYSIGIIDIHDSAKKDSFIAFRKQAISNYEEKYKDLPKFFYDKGFFLDFAEKHNMNIRFCCSNMDGYWNSEFIFNCFLTKNDAD